MVFSINFVSNASSSLGVFASSNNLSDAGRVTSSFVLKLNRHDIKTKNGLFHLLPTIVTDGSLKSFIWSLIIEITLLIFLLLIVIFFQYYLFWYADVSNHYLPRKFYSLPTQQAFLWQAESNCFVSLHTYPVNSAICSV